VFLYCPAFQKECWNNIGGMLIESPEGYLKIEMRLYQVYVVFPLVRVEDNVVLLKKLSQSERASRRTIIKLANIHERVQYLY